jgi:hypothetical protein
MKSVVTIMIAAMAAVMPVSEGEWYVGDGHCPPPKDDGKYSAPYRAIDHPGDYPAFSGADKPGWACSWQREDGVIVQFGDSRTPQEQWLSVWGDRSSPND